MGGALPIRRLKSPCLRREWVNQVLSLRDFDCNLIDRTRFKCEIAACLRKLSCRNDEKMLF
ncbi:hypothetical protein FACS189487_06080 [Campylobacterota bacterium]|nr:hypothetical protein FACS189487_06080 [Campylobacterota bacterium]